MSVFWFLRVFFCLYMCVPCVLRGYKKRLELQMVLSHPIDTQVL